MKRQLSRRRFLSATVNTLAAATAAAVMIPAGLHAMFPILRDGRGAGRASRRAAEERWIKLLRLENLRQGAMHEASYPLEDLSRPSTQMVYVWRGAHDEVVVFSRACTDLGCPIVWDAKSQCFFCPCHGGVFSRDGDRMAGPPNRPLWRYATRIRAGVVEVDLNSVPAAV